MKKIETKRYSIYWIDYEESINSKDDNLDIHVKFKNGPRFVATFFTLKNISTLMSDYKTTGECNNGMYFWAANMIIVEELNETTIIETVEELIKRGEFEYVFDGPYYHDSLDVN